MDVCIDNIIIIYGGNGLKHRLCPYTQCHNNVLICTTLIAQGHDDIFFLYAYLYIRLTIL